MSQLTNILFTLFLLFSSSFLEADASFSFDPSQMAKEETAAWKDYYTNDVPGLVRHLSQIVIVEFRLNQISAWKSVIPELLTAALLFKKLPENSTPNDYERLVLPHLVTAYEEIRKARHGNWDPHSAAKDELAWWIYRRDDKTSNPEIVGKKMADLYRQIYGSNDQQHFSRAGYLRAVAARYHDLSKKAWNQIEEQDWTIIETILTLSYQELLAGIETNSSRGV